MADELTQDMSALFTFGRTINILVRKGDKQDEVVRLITDLCDKSDAILAKDIVKDSGLDLTEHIANVAKGRAFIAE